MPYDSFTDRSSHSGAWADDKNPYAPLAAIDPNPQNASSLVPIGIWNHNGEILLHPDAVLPQRCVYTNLLCDESERRTSTLFSKNKIRLKQIAILLRGVGAACVIGVFIPPLTPVKTLFGFGAVCIALFFAWFIGVNSPSEINVSYSLSRHARNRQRTLQNAGAAIFLLGLGSFALSLKFLMTKWPLFILVFSGIGLISVGVLVLWIAFGSTRFVRFERTFPPYIAISGCDPEFVNLFPHSDELSAQLPKYLVDELRAKPDDQSH